MEEFKNILSNNSFDIIQLFAALEKKAAQCLNMKLFSVMEVNLSNNEAKRIYTNSPKVYPISGTKTIPEGIWADQVIREKKIFVANDYDTIAKIFPDHETIRSFGCEAIINIPIVIFGEIKGTINILGSKGSYLEEESFRKAEELKLLGILCFLAKDYALLMEGK